MTNPRTPKGPADPPRTVGAPPLQRERTRAYDVHSIDGREKIDAAVGGKVDEHPRRVGEIAAALPGLEVSAAAASLKRLRERGAVEGFGERGRRRYVTTRHDREEAGR